MPDGSTHDLEDLSSGEKEVLYGYMRLRSSAPKHSVVLVDEPELHLNPRLVRGLARFYLDHLVTAQSNQLWLISHSDTLLREAVNLDSFGVYHMRRGERSRFGENQLTLVTTEAEAERLVIELVGDLAAYRQAQRSCFSREEATLNSMCSSLAVSSPDVADLMNLVAAGNKRQVLALHRALEGIDPSALGTHFTRSTIAIALLASSTPHTSSPGTPTTLRTISWSRSNVFRAVSELTAADSALVGPAEVKTALRACAGERSTR